jgi:hypothetical protein
MMRALLLAMILAAGPALADSPTLLATFGQNSGSLPPPYAWRLAVQIFADRSVVVQYCKGYADSEPGCATVRDRANDDAMADLLAVLNVNLPDLVAHPPQATDDPPVGGGSVYGSVISGETVVKLPAFAVEADKDRVALVLAAVEAVIPQAAVNQAMAQAIGPKED